MSVALGASLIGCSAARHAPVLHEPVVVAFLGDSLTLGAQLLPEEQYPALLANRFGRLDVPIRAINAGFPGDTSAGALERLPAVLKEHPDVLVVAIGTNDATNGLPPSATEANLRAIVAQARGSGAAVVLAGEKFSRPWADDLTATIVSVAREQGAWLVYDLLAGVAGVEELNLPDGVHPNAQGQRVLAANVWPVLFPLVVDVSTARARLTAQ